jgi:hypothetical protein
MRTEQAKNNRKSSIAPAARMRKSILQFGAEHNPEEMDEAFLAALNQDENSTPYSHQCSS